MSEQDDLLLLEYVEGTLSGVDLDRVRARLKADPALAARVEAMRADAVAVRAVGAEMSREATRGIKPGAPLPEKVRQALGEETGTPARRTGEGRGWRLEWIVAGAGVAAMIAISVLSIFAPSDPVPATPMASALRPESSRLADADGAERRANKKREEAPLLSAEAPPREVAAAPVGADVMSDHLRSAATPAPAPQVALAESKAEAAAPAGDAAKPSEGPAPAAAAMPMEKLAIAPEPASEQLQMRAVGKASSIFKEGAATTPTDDNAAGDKPSPSRMERQAARDEANTRALAAAKAGRPPVESETLTIDLGGKRDETAGAAEVVVEAASVDAANRAILDWAAARRIELKRPPRGARVADGEQAVASVSSVDLADLILKLNGMRGVTARLDSAPTGVKAYVSTAIDRSAKVVALAGKDAAAIEADEKAKTAERKDAKPAATQPAAKPFDSKKVLLTTLTIRQVRPETKPRK